MTNSSPFFINDFHLALGMMTRMRKYDDLKREKGIKDLYPYLSKDQLKEAEYNLNRYLEVCLQIFEENEKESKMSTY